MFAVDVSPFGMPFQPFPTELVGGINFHSRSPNGALSSDAAAWKCCEQQLTSIYT